MTAVTSPRSLTPSPRSGLSRRRFVALAGGATGLVAVGARPALATTALSSGALKAYPFTLGVASGDPAPDGAVLWSRLAPEPLLADGGMPDLPVTVEWKVARRPSMTSVAREGEFVTAAASAHSLHVEVDGLEPEREYWYRFRAGRHLSDVGRLRTLPAAGSAVNGLAMAVVSAKPSSPDAMRRTGTSLSRSSTSSCTSATTSTKDLDPPHLSRGRTGDTCRSPPCAPLRSTGSATRSRLTETAPTFLHRDRTGDRPGRRTPGSGGCDHWQWVDGVEWCRPCLDHRGMRRDDVVHDQVSRWNCCGPPSGHDGGM